MIRGPVPTTMAGSFLLEENVGNDLHVERPAAAPDLALREV